MSGRSWFVLAVLLVAVVPNAFAGPGPVPAAGEPDACAQESTLAAETCASVQIGMYANPNPTPPGGSVSFTASSHPETDCWDNLGHEWWGGTTFSQPVHDAFTWVVYCMGDGVQSNSLGIGVASGGGGGGGGGGAGGAVPATTNLPAITGSPEVEQTLTASPGSWTNDPTGYTYVWRRSGDLAELGRGASLLLDQAHVGHQIRVDVLACNGTGCGAWASSAWTAAVAEGPPVYDPAYAEGSDSDEFSLTTLCSGQSCPAALVSGPSAGPNQVTGNAVCARVEAHVTRSNSFTRLWRMRHSLSFCADRSRITRVWDRLLDGEILVPGWARTFYPWEWIVVSDSPPATRVSSSTSFGRLRFSMCGMFRHVGPICAIAEPWIEITLYGDGRAICGSSIGRIRNCSVRF
jgi:hypothetical protein